MHLASGDINAEYGVLPEGQDASVDATVQLMSEMAKGKWGARSPKVRALAINIINKANVPDKDYFGMVDAIHNYVRDEIRYVKDVVGQETLSYPEETLFNSKAEDCLAAGTRLLTPKGYKNVEDIRVGDTIQGKNGWTKVLKFWDKGVLPTWKIHLSNGAYFQATADHKCFLLDGSEKKVSELRAKDALLGPATIELPERTAFLSDDDFYFVGLYLADGWSSGNKTCISGKDGFAKEAQKHWVKAWAEAKGWPVTWHPRYITVYIPKTHELFELLHDGRLAPEKAVPDIILANLTSAKTRRLREGLFADFHDPVLSKRAIGAELLRKKNKTKMTCGGGCYSTTSHDLAKQVRLLLRFEGFSVSDSLVVEHGGLGSHPVHRIYPRFFRDKPAKVEEIVESGVAHVYDLQTADQGIFLPDADVVVHNCDGKSIAEMALLGSIGIRSYPVVIGLIPNHFSHVYIHVEIPPGKGRYAGQTIAADPIMREWSLGTAAPDARVKAKRVYPHLAGLGTMSINGYASGPAYFSPQDELEAAQVKRVMKSRYVDTGSRGEVVNTKRLNQWGDELDDMFNRNASISPMQAAPSYDLYNRGPVTNHAEKQLTSYLHRAVPSKRISAPMSEHQRGKNFVTIQDRNAPKRKTPVAPSVGELLGLADYLNELSGEAAAAGRQHLVSGKHDPIHRVAAAVALTKQRAARASGRVVRAEQNAGFLFGLGAFAAKKQPSPGFWGGVTPGPWPMPAPHVELSRAKAIEKLAHQISAQADQLAKLCVGYSPIRRNHFDGLLGALEHLNYNLSAVDTVAQLAPEDHPADDAQVKVDTLAMVLSSPTFREASIYKATPATPNAPKSPIVGVLPEGAVVRDQKGRVTYSDDGSDDLEGGLGRWGGFRRVTQAVKKVATAPAKAIERAQAKVKETAKNPKFRKLALGVATGGASLLTKKTIDLAKKVAHDKRLRNIALGIATGGASLLTKSTVDMARGAMGKKKKGGGEAAAPADESVMTPDSTTPPVSDPPEDQSIIPGPGESSYDANQDPSGSPAESFGPEDMGPADEAESVAADEQNMSAGGGEGQSFTNTRDVNEGEDPFAAGGSATEDEGAEGAGPGMMEEGAQGGPGDMSEAGPADEDTYESADDGDDTEDEGGGEDSVVTPPVEGLAGNHRGMIHGKRGWVPRPPGHTGVEGFSTAGVSVGALALAGLGLYLITRKKK